VTASDPIVHRLLPTVLFTAAVLMIPVGTASAAEQDFTLSVHYAGLYPDSDTIVAVTVHNPQSFPLHVHTAVVHVDDASPACRAENLVAHSFTGDIVVPADADGSIPIRFQMPAAAPDACQGATFPLTFAASADAGAAGTMSSGDTPSSGGFAFTGAESGATALAGVTALGIGALLLAARRRRPDEVAR
jgi:hypothetical protein